MRTGDGNNEWFGPSPPRYVGNDGREVRGGWRDVWRVGGRSEGCFRESILYDSHDLGNRIWASESRGLPPIGWYKGLVWVDLNRHLGRC